MEALASLFGAISGNAFALFTGAVIGVIIASALMHTRLTRLVQPFLDEITLVAEVFKDIIKSHKIQEYQVLLGLCSIAFAIFSGFVIHAVLTLISNFSTPFG